MDTILPWHDSLWQQVLRRQQQDRLPHAFLLCGPPGMGKAWFARRLAAILLCEKSFQLPEAERLESACGHCQSCHLLTAETHPDLLLVQPTAGGQLISVEQIRELIKFCSLTSYYGRYQIVIINPAEAMNRNAANSLLKLLEEPPPNTLFMLISHQPMALLATIRSRCQRLDFSHPNRDLTQAWLHKQLKHSSEFNIPLLLNLSAQAPLAALTLVTNEGMAKRREFFDSLIQLSNAQHDPIKIAEKWTQLETTLIWQWLLSWTMDIIRYAATGQTKYFINQDYQNPLQSLAKQLDLPNWFELLDSQQEAYQLIVKNTNVKLQGLLESIAITWVKLTAQPRRNSL